MKFLKLNNTRFLRKLKKNLPQIKELILSNTLYKIVLVSRNPSLNSVPVSPQGKNISASTILLKGYCFPVNFYLGCTLGWDSTENKPRTGFGLDTQNKGRDLTRANREDKGCVNSWVNTG